MTDWDQHYKSGGESGNPDDYARAMADRWSVLTKYICFGIDTVLDLGCGDLQFWDDYPLGSWYTGVDISDTIIGKNQKSYPLANFEICNIAEYRGASCDVVLCSDVLFHIIDDDEYVRILQNIARHTNRVAIIRTWDTNPLNTITSRLMRLKATGTFVFGENTTDGYHQAYRRVEDFSQQAFEGFSLSRPAKNTYVFERR